ncbi:MAG: hypothetical protein R3Y28_02710 [Candidatus Gastranaerophilales bacterium]
MNLFQKIIYRILSLKEKSLRARLDGHLKTSGVNSTSKTIMSSNVTLTLNTETTKNVAIVKDSIEKIVSSANCEPLRLLAFVESKGTKVYKNSFADKILSVLQEEEGLICPQSGLSAIYLSIMILGKFSLKTEPMFVMREGEIDPFFMVHQFYKWYSLINNLPGYDEKSQKLFKKYFYYDADADLSNLKLDEIVGLQEAVARDKEATSYALELAKAKEGSRKVLEKISNEGSAEV